MRSAGYRLSVVVVVFLIALTAVPEHVVAQPPSLLQFGGQKGDSRKQKGGKQFGGIKKGSVTQPSDPRRGGGSKNEPGQERRGRKGRDHGDRENGWPNLPPEFQTISNEEFKELTFLCEKALAWIIDAKQKSSRPEDIADFFGVAALRKAEKTSVDDEENDANNESQKEFGTKLFSAFSSSQQASLVKLMLEQRTALQQYQEQRSLFIDELAKLRDAKKINERQLLQMAEALGEAEGSLGFAQAQCFAELQKSIDPDHIEYLRILRANPTTIDGIPSGAAAQKAQDTLNRLEDGDRKALQALAVKAFSWLTGSAKQNAEWAPGRTANYFGNVKSRGRGKTDTLAAEFLGALNPAQRQQMARLLKGQSRLMRDYLAKRAQLSAGLLGLKESKAIIEKKFSIAAGNLGELEGQLALVQAKVFEQMRGTVSDAQQVFFRHNLLADDSTANGAPAVEQ